MIYGLIVVFTLVLAALLMISIRCPNCKKFNYFERANKVGVPDASSSKKGLWTVRKCGSCGHVCENHKNYPVD